MLQSDNRQQRKVVFMKKKRKGFFRGFIAGIAVSVAGVFAMGAFLYHQYGMTLAQGIPGQAIPASQKVGSQSVVDDELIAKLRVLEYYVDQAFLMEKGDKEALKAGIYKGYMEALEDPYTCYYTEEEYNQLMEATSGIYSGIGIMVSQNVQTMQISVVRVFEGCPGEEAGLLPEDILVEVAGMDITGMDLNTVVSYMKGQEGTKVKLKVYRSTINDFVEMDVERRSIEVPTVESEMLDDSIGYIMITEFDAVTSDQYKEQVNQLKAEGMKGLIVDVRGNPGGRLDIVVDMLDYMLPEGRIVYTEDKYGQGETFTSDAEHYFDMPLAVLVNGNSASAAEIFAGAIQDYGIGTIVGTTTFGKGIVQHIYPFNDGTAIKLTVSKYFTPSGTCIHEVGIIPDVEVELDEALRTAVSIAFEEDNQLQEAVSVIKQMLK